MRYLARLCVIPLLLAFPAAHAAEIPPSLAPLAAKVAPAIVSVTSLSPSQHSSAAGQGGDPAQQASTGEDSTGIVVPPPKTLESLGSGFIFNDEGYILTNNHVVADASDITVTLADGTVYPAIIAGRDPDADLAVLKINAPHKLPFLRFGNASQMKVGDWVLAVGNPYGMANTNTFGIISALHRDIGENKYDDFIQTDAAINRGNSGGPLLNMQGQVIGVDSAIYAPTGTSDGIGFAIPASMAAPVADALMHNGQMTRGWLGLSTEDVTPAIQTALDLPGTEGALIGAVAENSPSYGILQPGDDILAVGDEKVSSTRALYIRMAEIQAGQSVRVDYVRDGVAHHAQLTVTVPPPAALNVMAGQVPAPAPVMLPAYGLALGAMPAGSGVKISAVSGPAAKAGLKAGDVILQINGQVVSNAQDFVHVAQTLGHDPAVLLIAGSSAPHWVAVQAVPTSK